MLENRAVETRKVIEGPEKEQKIRKHQASSEMNNLG